MNEALTITKIANALKVNYLPAWQNQLGIEPTALLAKIKKVPLTGDEINATAPIGLSGAFGFSSEGMETPAAGHINYAKYKAYSKDMYANICLSEKSIRLTGPKGSMVNALKSEIDGAYATAKWNVSRAIFGNGTGILAQVTATSGAKNTITVDDTKFLKEGLIVDIYNDSEEIQGNGEGRRIVAVDRAKKTFTISGAATDFIKGFVTVQKSYKKEITGLGAIFDDGITSLYGVSKADNPYINPVVVDAKADINDSVINSALRTSKNDKGGNIDMLLCGDKAYDAYTEYLHMMKRQVNQNKLTGGFTSIDYLFGNKNIDMVNESFVPENEIWGIDTKSLALHQTDWAFAEQGSAGIFNLMEGQSIYRALLCNYGELICNNPGSCVRIANCAA